MPRLTLPTFQLTLTGIRPLKTHNAQLANPLNNFVIEMKKITSIRKKTEEHYRKLSDLEFLGGLYVNEKNLPIVPSHMVEGMLNEAAKVYRKGKDLKSALDVLDDAVIEHSHVDPKKLASKLTAEQLLAMPEYRVMPCVKVQQARIIRTHPFFRHWRITFQLQLDTELIDEHMFREICEVGGRRIGLGDYRPKMGKFEVTLFKKIG